MGKVIIMRGLPGSGKSSWIERGIRGSDLDLPAVCSADFFLTTEEGGYKFDPTKIGEAHDCCLRDFIHFLKNPEAKVIVDNTNLTAWEIAPYYRLAQVEGYEVEIVRVECDPIKAWQRNTHGVPLEAVLRMYRTLLMEQLPHHWKEKVVLAA